MSKESISEFMKRRKTGNVDRLKQNGFTDEDINRHQQKVHEKWKKKNGYVPLSRRNGKPKSR